MLCKFYTFEKNNNLCVLYEDCNTKEECEDCASGPRECYLGYHGTASSTFTTLHLALQEQTKRTLLDSTGKNDVEEKRIREQFREEDEDGDGVITADDIRIRAKKYSVIITVEKSLQMIRDVDTNGDGNVNFEEYKKKKREKAAEMRKQRVKDMFMILDQDGDGFFTAKELRDEVNQLANKGRTEIRLSISVEESLRMIADIDSNGDGKVSLEEYTKMEEEKEEKATKRSEKKDEFIMLDLDGNGKITAEELWLKVQGHKQNKKSAEWRWSQKMMTDADTDGDGEINLDEYMLYKIK